ncbi:MAG: LLM class flavin-dependent oxidoreductase [Myxococcota bacterium]
MQRGRERLAQAPAARPDPLRAPLSFAQERMLFLDELTPGSAAYLEHVLLRLRGPLDADALERALAAVVARHDALRTSFVGGEQRVDPAATVPLVREDLRGLPADRREAGLRQRVTEAARRPFDLSCGPLLRAALLQLGDADHALLLVNHHAVSDAWSRGVLLRELGAAYAAGLRGEAPDLPQVAQQVGDHAARVRERAASGAHDADLAWWRAQLAEPRTALALPTDRPRPPMQAHRGGVRTFAVPAATVAGAAALARALGATPFAVLLAAFDAVLARASGDDDLWVATPTAGRDHPGWEGVVGCLVNTVVLRVSAAGDPPFRELCERTREAVQGALSHAAVPFEQLVADLRPPRDPSRSPLCQVMFTLQNAPQGALALPGLAVEAVQADAGTARLDLTVELVPAPDGGLAGRIEYDADLFDGDTAARFGERYVAVLAAGVAAPERRLSELPAVGPAEAAQLAQFGTPAPDGGERAPFGARFARCCAERPDAPALSGGGRTWTYAELDAWSAGWAAALRDRGVAAGSRVGVRLPHGPDLLAALLAIWRLGAAYVPLDPDHPAQRQRLVVEDAGLALVVGEDTLPEPALAMVPWPEAPDEAYLFYTSGSTGRPKGVAVGHDNLAAFFDAMDRLLGADTPPVWLALTSAAFDISVLELFWPLTRGGHVVAPTRADLEAPGDDDAAPAQRLDLGLFFFASEGTDRPYALLLDAARFADREGLASVWTPERHFHAFGAPFPNPAVTGAALAAVTERVAIRAGSVVLPLHHPLRVAEEWAVVDQLSGGRAGVSVASGWHADDFVLAPDAWAARREGLGEGLEQLRRLWRGEAATLPNGVGEPVAVRTSPRPVQAELPAWVTASGDPETFALAGRHGAGVLTHLLGQSLGDLADKIARYRTSWRAAGHPGEGHVVLMLHAFLGDDADAVRAEVREPFCAYLRTSLGLVHNLARSLGIDVDAAGFDEGDLAALLDHAFARYADDSALFGTVDSVMPLVERIMALGVDELACLVDFGLPAARVLGALPHLVALQRRANRRAPAVHPLLRAAAAHGVTHFQCTPALARALGPDPDFGPVHTLLVGGEALPHDLGTALAARVPRLLDVYGPTEATIWATAAEIRADAQRITLGTPLAHATVRILDAERRPVPIGVTGELFLGGEAVARGYHQRPALQAERFVDDAVHGRLFRTGDLGRWLADGTIEFLGRNDRQVKLRGVRIELGEVEAHLRRHPAVRDAVAEIRGAEPDRRLVAWVVGRLDAVRPEALRAHLRERVPEAMIPSAFVPLDALPLNPNGKLDRAALPAPDPARPDLVEPVLAPRTALERDVAAVWAEELGLQRIGVRDDFFALGGHSLLATRVVARLQVEVGPGLSLRDFVHAPTVEASAARLGRAAHPRIAP